jgi:hypothetical protein
LKSLLWLGFLVAFGAAAVPASAQPIDDFGTPPSGTIPILFNDHHVYAKPSGVQGNRVIAALVRGDEVLVPLRSMFEQMGATVSYDGNSRTVVVSAPQRTIQLTVDEPVVVINGESRPLDVPPLVVNGIVLVPVRVISEALGAYVQWDPAIRVVVVRYLSNSSVPSPSGPLVTPVPLVVPAAPATVASPIPTPLFGAPPTPNPNEYFVAGDIDVFSKTYNALSPGNSGSGGSYDVRGAVEFPLLHIPLMLEGNYDTFGFAHDSTIAPSLLGSGLNPCPNYGTLPPFPAAKNEGCVTQLGGFSQMPIGSFTAHESQFDGKLGFKVFDPRVYFGVSYLNVTSDFGDQLDYPSTNGVGFGLEKIPDVKHTTSLYGGIWYYPSVTANFTYPVDGSVPPALAGTSAKLVERVTTYQAGATVGIGRTPVFLDLGFLSDALHANVEPNAASHTSAYAGLGLRF